jgi:hypothetical protein
MEVITMAVGVLLIGVCAIALIYLGILLVMGVAWFIGTYF